MRRLTTILALALTTSVSATAVAQDDSDERYVETVAQDVEDPRAPTGFATDVDLRDSTMSGEDLGDSLQRVPGLFVLRQSSFGQSAFATVRGGNPRQLSVSINGVELTIPAGIGFDVGSTSVVGLDKARVFRGAAGIHRGSGALTGAVELGSSLPREKGNRIRLSALGGSFGTAAGSIESAIASEWAALELGAATRTSQGDFEFEDGSSTIRRLNNDHERQAVFANTGIQVSNYSRLESSARYEQGERGTPGPSEFQDVLSGARSTDQQAVATARYDYQSIMRGYSVGAADLYTMAGAQWRKQSYTNDQTVLGAGEFDSDSEYVATSVGAGVIHFRDAREMELSNVFRADYKFVNEGYVASERGVFTSDIDTGRQTHSYSVSDEIILWNELSVLIGSRWESIDGEREETAWLPFAGVSYDLYKELDLRANVARTYRPPDFDELYLNSEILRGDADLVSERATAVDAGARLTLEDVRAEVTLFANAIENPIRFLPVSVYVTQAQNLDDYTALGSELSGEWVVHPRLAVRGAYTFTHAQLSEVEEQAPAVPSHVGEVGVTAELAGWVPVVERLQVGSEARVRSAINLDIFGNIESPAWVDWGAHVLVAPLEWLDVRFTANNLLDRRDVTDVLQQPLPGRSFFVGLQVETGEP